MKGDYFDYPKPINLIEYLTNFICKDGDIVIDFFAGSGTTGESVFNYNLKNTTKLKFILVQLQEVLDVNYANDSEERKKIENTIKFLESINKPSNISELGKERIRLAGKRIKEVNPEKAKDLDLGFKVFKLDSSNIKAWSPDSENLEQNLLDAVENIKEGRSENDLLFEILLKYGLDLTLPITEHNIAGAKVFNVGAGALLVCLADDINEAVAEGIAELKKELNPEICRVVFKDNGFEDSAEKTNVMQKLKQHSIEEVRSI
jgi:adenine-specific DNA-methyltransferase